jgi:hypothetical protein
VKHDARREEDRGEKRSIEEQLRRVRSLEKGDKRCAGVVWSPSDEVIVAASTKFIVAPDEQECS